MHLSSTVRRTWHGSHARLQLVLEAAGSGSHNDLLRVCVVAGCCVSTQRRPRRLPPVKLCVTKSGGRRRQLSVRLCPARWAPGVHAPMHMHLNSHMSCPCLTIYAHSQVQALAGLQGAKAHCITGSPSIEKLQFLKACKPSMLSKHAMDEIRSIPWSMASTSARKLFAVN